jgi:tetratricopeptide (TPR) repeat protein
MLVAAAIAANLLFANVGAMKGIRQGAAAASALADDIIDALPPGGVILGSEYGDTSLFLYKMLGEGRDSAKGWRVLANTQWKRKLRVAEVRGLDIDPANKAATYDVSEVARLVDGEEIDWGPLTLRDKYRGRHEVFFSHPDKVIMDMAGFVSEPVVLKGGGEGSTLTVKGYRVVNPSGRMTAAEIVETYDRGLGLLRRGEVEDALKVFAFLLEYNPTFAEAEFQAGMCYRGMKNYDEARKRWKQVLEWVPGYPPALDALGTLPLPKGQSVAETGIYSVE